MSINVLVACGSGVATSTVVEARLNEIVSDNNLDVKLKKTSMSELEGMLSDADLVVVTSTFSKDNSKVPIISGTALLTGIGEDEFIEKFIQEMN